MITLFIKLQLILRIQTELWEKFVDLGPVDKLIVMKQMKEKGSSSELLFRLNCSWFWSDDKKHH
ncbi:hypothetical protein T08_37 [Trichinella sp. T8]|nr:hypothetical protein T08_37 [Trichinella sp. T8]